MKYHDALWLHETGRGNTALYFQAAKDGGGVEIIEAAAPYHRHDMATCRARSVVAPAVDVE